MGIVDIGEYRNKKMDQKQIAVEDLNLSHLLRVRIK